MRYGKRTPYFIPATFRYRLKQGVTPRVCQIVALSQITGYRFSDWMKVCGFDLQLILALQLRLQSERTSILISGDSVEGRYHVISSSNEKGEKPSGHIFAKVGTRDAVLYPRLAPGSIVRVDCTCYPPVHQKGVVDPRIWLVEHASGLTCCQIKRMDADHVFLLPNCPPLSRWPLRLSRDARILGMVDLELRRRRVAPNRPLSYRNVRETVPPMLPCSGASGISRLLRSSRSRAGLTLRAAHQMTMRIASLLENPEYGIALGLLSDYEAMNKLPRHVAKIISLSAVYSINPFELLQASGIHINDSEKRPLFLSEHANASGRFIDLLTRTNSELFWFDSEFDLCIPPLGQRSIPHAARA